MVNLLDSLGLDDVIDPDALPDAKYAGVIFKCEYVKSKTDKLGVAITYKVQDPDSQYNDAEKFEWWTIGEGHVRQENGDWVFDKAAMAEQQKPYFNRRMAQIGIPKSVLGDLKDEHLKSRVGLPVFFGIKNKDGYNNVNYVELRGDNVAIDPFTPPSTDTSATTTSPTTPSGGSNLADDI